MKTVFFACCVAAIAYCALYAAYYAIKRRVSEAVSAGVMTLIAAGAAAMLLFAA